MVGFAFFSLFFSPTVPSCSSNARLRLCDVCFGLGGSNSICVSQKKENEISPHIVIVRMPLRVTAVIVMLLLMLPVCVVPVPISPVLSAPIIVPAMAVLLVIAVRLGIVIDIITLGVAIMAGGLFCTRQ